jgi:2-(1,2-epoxy-1,2-dihydrophenyl)acetyl-CoA isomerase
MDQPVNLRKKKGTALLTLNRPEAYNAFGLDMIRLLAEILIELAVDRNVTGVVISGAGKAFCAGGDLRWISNAGRDTARGNDVYGIFRPQ